MVRKLAGYVAGLTALYIIVANGSNFGKVMSSTGTAAQGFEKTLQGR